MKQARTRAEAATKHGLSFTPVHRCWSSMLSRCRNRNHVGFRDYGGRGIKVCERWHDFRNFLADMGDRPSLKHSIDRIDNDGNYEPGNCRWATRSEQQRNKRVNRTSKSGITGVHWLEKDNRWRVVWTFVTLEEALQARAYYLTVMAQRAALNTNVKTGAAA